jgi:hypothetical protein
MAILDRSYDNIRTTTVVKEVAQRTSALLANFLPNRDVQTRTFQIKSYSPDNGAASYRAFDTPAPVASRVGFTEMTGKLPPMSEQMIIGEDETLGIFERAVAGDWDAEVEQAIFNDAARLTQRNLNRVEQARGQVLETGKFTLAGEGGLTLEADFGRDAGNAVTRSGVWSTPATDIFADIRGVVVKSTDERDVPIDAMLCSENVITRMLLNDGIRTMLYPNGANVPQIIARSDLSALFAAHGLPQVIPYQHKVGGVATVTDDVVIFLPANAGNRLGGTEWGVTAEALELGLSFGTRPGPVGVVMANEDPVWRATKVSSLVMPVLNDANLIYTMDTEA